MNENDEKSACGVGFLASRKNAATHAHIEKALYALRCLEHRGACGADGVSSDGAGIMTDIPYDLFGHEKGTVAIATLFIPFDSEGQRIALKLLTETFEFFDLTISSFRDVPMNLHVLGVDARKSMPAIKHMVIKRPDHLRTDSSFNRILYIAKQYTRARASERGMNEFFFPSISTNTIVYKALTTADKLDALYLDLKNPQYKTRFALFHRRFSTNTRTSWDKAQPFRLIAHNGEINTIAGNRSWAFSREKSLGLKAGELLSHHNISDTGSLNEMAEALLYRSSIPFIDDVMSILIPPANSDKPFYKFWGRAMESWDGPAFVTFSDGQTVGARLDRNGFRPCRWAMTDNHFYLSSEAGAFNIDESIITQKGTLHAGTGVRVDLESGEIDFKDSSESAEYFDAKFDAHLIPALTLEAQHLPNYLEKKDVFGYTKEDINKILIPMIQSGKEPIGSMGDTARPAIFSTEPRPFFDYFYQNFAQVTNPPVDYIRETTVTDLSTELGKKPNIFSTKELIPPAVAIELKSPVLSLGQMKYIDSFKREASPSIKDSNKLESPDTRIIAEEFSITFKRIEGSVGFRSKLNELRMTTLAAVRRGVSIIILTDKHADFENLPIPSLIALRAVVNSLNNEGIRLDASIVIHTGEVRSTHHLSTLIGFGATGVCPYLALEIARFHDLGNGSQSNPQLQENNLIKAYEQGLLKTMSKMGISVLKSYQSARLFSALGIGKKLADEFFPELYSPIGGIEQDELVTEIIHNASKFEQGNTTLHTYQYKEHNSGEEGEKHSMTNSRSRLIHQLVRESHTPLSSMKLFEEYLRVGEEVSPISIRHLFDFKKIQHPLPIEEIEPISSILTTFGSGAMSFGAISAEAQRDIFIAMKTIGGRSNSGEGGENPYYFSDGISAHTKQVASARFGVTAEYLITGKELQIKIAQGAKPGEGGQLMAVKVNEDIARARFALTGIDLISPPPMHDIYSIEDLKELIYELRQTNPLAKINVKLVSGAGVGTIAVGVAKAGADIIHISGGDGGTGAASLSSMKHAGMQWELGLLEAHKALLQNNLRQSVTLRVDGGFSTGKDVVLAAILGAEQYEFGKLLLVAEGCVMARICEKNTCPTGIATHDPKFKAKYKGNPEHIISLLTMLAEDVQRHLAALGIRSLHEIIGRTELLKINPVHVSLINSRNLDLSFFTADNALTITSQVAASEGLFIEEVNSLNKKILEDAAPVLLKSKESKSSVFEGEYNIFPTDRAILATLSGQIAKLMSESRIENHFGLHNPIFSGSLNLNFYGSAGQGFGVFLTNGISAKLFGEANDSVCKGMSGGKVVIVPSLKSTFKPEQNVIIGNCALYGATGGKLYVNGLAGDRFAVRNSGAVTVVEGVGLHACEYMTNGLVVILGQVSYNLGAGMTGGKLYLYGEKNHFVNLQYITSLELTPSDEEELSQLLKDYFDETSSNTAKRMLENWSNEKIHFKKYLPIGLTHRLHETSQMKLA